MAKGKKATIGSQEQAIQKHRDILIDAKNLILRGAPGTGKTYLAKQIAASVVSNGEIDRYEDLSLEQKAQIEFVQFHPSYDYADFVEGLRPSLNDDGSMGFELRDGVFKQFVDRAIQNYENSRKTSEVIAKEKIVRDSMEYFFNDVDFGKTEYTKINGSVFTITDVDDKLVYVRGNETSDELEIKLDEIRKLLLSDEQFESVTAAASFFGRSRQRKDSYNLPIYQQIKKREAKITTDSKVEVEREELKQFVFIIDEINRGEMSKIFGELFFAIDPGYRGEAGAVSTQYANLHSDPDEKFYIPENVYIIGTMNDIDRSVDSFDFAMRRRFRFVELKANDNLEMLSALGDKKKEASAKMLALNNAIASDEDLNENYQVGAAYFLKLKTLSFDELWADYLQPLLQEYIQGTYNENSRMSRFKKAYDNAEFDQGDSNEIAHDQG